MCNSNRAYRVWVKKRDRKSVCKRLIGGNGRTLQFMFKKQNRKEALMGLI